MSVSTQALLITLRFRSFIAINRKLPGKYLKDPAAVKKAVTLKRKMEEAL